MSRARAEARVCRRLSRPAGPGAAGRAARCCRPASTGSPTSRSYGGYTTNLPLADLLGGKAWIAFQYGGADLTPEHGGPARLLVPHLYLWKSAKWVTGIDLMTTDKQGFWESLGYHNYGDPWREQRYWGD